MTEDIKEVPTFQIIWDYLGPIPACNTLKGLWELSFQKSVHGFQTNNDSNSSLKKDTFEYKSIYTKRHIK